MSAVLSRDEVKQARRPSRRKGRDLWIALAFLAPNLLGFLVFTAGPVISSLMMSFTDRSMLEPTSNFVGLRNYADLVADPLFWIFLANTAYFFLGLPLSLAGSLFLASLLNQKIKGSAIFRTLLYLPSFTAGVALMILWKQLLNPDFGLINAALQHLGLPKESAPQWLNSTKNLLAINPERLAFDPTQFGIGARDALILMGIWTGIGGGNMLLYLAALGNVPEELSEAAALDGASGWKTFRHITWPQLAPTTFFIVVMSVIGGFQGGFDTAKVMTGGGPVNTTTTLAYHIYQKAFEQFQIGYASAVSWALFAIVFAITIVNWKFGNREDLVS
ncbi:sugar ABC transporter permease [bacterium]|nr:MAG: sugar ABC transporter permease [bacterium]